MATYSCTLKIHLPKDDDWGRTDIYNAPIPVTADNPNQLVERVIGAIVGASGMATDPNYLCGLFVNMVNRFPANMRAAVAAGIINGSEMQMSAEGGSIVAEFVRGFESLPDPQGNTQRPSGIIVPGSE